MFLYKGKFSFKDGVIIKKSLEVYNCLISCLKISFININKVLIIYK